MDDIFYDILAVSEISLLLSKHLWTRSKLRITVLRASHGLRDGSSLSDFSASRLGRACSLSFFGRTISDNM